MDSAVAGLIGVAIGASSSLVAVWIQAYYLTKRERAKFVMEFAASDRRGALEDAIRFNKGGGVAPVALYAHYHQRLLELVEQGKVSDVELKKLSQETDLIWKAMKEIDAEKSDRV
ncbi:hypothetical protein [Pseudomonas laurylsulfatiphila]